MKRFLVSLLLVLTLASVLFAQAVNESNTVESTTYVFTDSLGREVTIPKEIVRVAPSGNVAQLAIYAVAPEKMVGWSTKLSNSAMATFLPDVANLPVFGAFYGKKANLNKEALIAANPEVVIDVGEIKGSVEAMTSQLDELSKEIGIPVIFVEGYLQNSDKMFKTLGELLGKEEAADKLAQFTRAALDKAEANKNSINTTIYYSSSQDGLSAIQEGSFHGEVIEYIGAKNIVPSTFTGSNGTASLEQIYLWDPDVILLSNADAVATAKTDKAWGELKAVKNGNVYKIPSTPYSFLDSPPATNRIIGIYWLGSLLNQEAYNEDLVGKTIEFYSLFYHKDLTRDEAQALL